MKTKIVLTTIIITVRLITIFEMFIDNEFHEQFFI